MFPARTPPLVSRCCFGTRATAPRPPAAARPAPPSASSAPLLIVSIHMTHGMCMVAIAYPSFAAARPFSLAGLSPWPPSPARCEPACHPTVQHCAVSHTSLFRSSMARCSWFCFATSSALRCRSAARSLLRAACAWVRQRCRHRHRYRLDRAWERRLIPPCTALPAANGAGRFRSAGCPHPPPRSPGATAAGAAQPPPTAASLRTSRPQAATFHRLWVQGDIRQRVAACGKWKHTNRENKEEAIGHAMPCCTLFERLQIAGCKAKLAACMQQLRLQPGIDAMSRRCALHTLLSLILFFAPSFPLFLLSLSFLPTPSPAPHPPNVPNVL